MASRIKYKLLKKASGLYSRLQKLQARRNGGEFINRDGSVKMKAVRYGGRARGGPIVRMPLYQAKEQSIKRQMRDLIEDTSGFGFNTFLLNQVTSPPNDYALQQRTRNGEIDWNRKFNIGSRILSGQ